MAQQDVRHCLSGTSRSYGAQEFEDLGEEGA
jgi:hypothetical protein